MKNIKCTRRRIRAIEDALWVSLHDKEWTYRCQFSINVIDQDGEQVGEVLSNRSVIMSVHAFKVGEIIECSSILLTCCCSNILEIMSGYLGLQIHGD